MKKLTLFFLILFTCKGIAQLPAKLDSLMPEYEKLKEDTLKVEKFLFVATQLATIDTTLSGKYGRRA
ncbi:MAG: hypothetical protein IT237_07335, partial [Bacteroidia bacterium]|nr:hypothetical protein [Bacteroidia bacterium]